MLVLINLIDGPFFMLECFETTNMQELKNRIVKALLGLDLVRLL